MKKEKKCIVCDTELSNSLAKYCSRCKKILNRVDIRKNPNREARISALRQSWDGESFRCYYTGIKLDELNPNNPRYLTFDHLTPRQEDDIVIVAWLINDMKSDMSDKEFRRMVIQLATKFNGGQFDEKAFNLKYWKRV